MYHTSELLRGIDPASDSPLKNLVAESLAKAAQAGISPALTQEGFSFEKPAAILEDFPAQFESFIPRTGMPEMNASVTSWKTLKSIGTDGPPTVSTSTAGKGSRILKENVDRSAPIARLAVQEQIIDDAQVFARGFDDLVTLGHLLQTMVLKRLVAQYHYGGNRTAALGVPVAPSVAVNGGAGSLSAGLTLTYKITAKTIAGREFAVGTIFTGTTPGAYMGHVLAPNDSQGDLIDVSANGESDVGPASAATGPTTLNDQHVLTWASIPNAASYGVYVDTGGGGFDWESDTDLNTFTVNTDPSTTNNVAPVADTSIDANAYDGIIQRFGLEGQPIVSLNGAALTGSGAKKSINEWVTQFGVVHRANGGKANTGPTDIFIHPDHWAELPEKIGGTSATVVNLTATGDNTSFKGGMIVDQVLNPYTKEVVNIHSDPTIPSGWNVALRLSSPYDHARLGGNAIDAVVAKEYWATTFAKEDYSVMIGLSTMHTLRVRSALGGFILTDVGT